MIQATSSVISVRQITWHPALRDNGWQEPAILRQKPPIETADTSEDEVVDCLRKRRGRRPPQVLVRKAPYLSRHPVCKRCEERGKCVAAKK